MRTRVPVVTAPLARIGAQLDAVTDVFRRRARGESPVDGPPSSERRADDRPSESGPSDGAATRPSRISGTLVLRIVTVGVALVVIATVVFLFIFPTAQWRDQRRQIDEARQQAAEISAEIEELEARVVDLQNPATIERIARERFGFARPDEEAFRLQPPPADAASFPPSWPWDGFERLVNGDVSGQE
jgi:cell division protein FtsL